VEALRATHGGAVIVTPGFDQTEIASQDFAEACGIVADHRQAAAPLRPTEGQCGDDSLAAPALSCVIYTREG